MSSKRWVTQETGVSRNQHVARKVDHENPDSQIPRVFRNRLETMHPPQCTQQALKERSWKSEGGQIVLNSIRVRSFSHNRAGITALQLPSLICRISCFIVIE